VTANQTAGKTPPDSVRQTDIAGIRRLLGQAALSHASADVFSTEKTKRKIVNL
jgi:hypothetical protein